MAKPAARIAALQFFLLMGGLALLSRAAYLQIAHGAELAAKAERQRTVRRELDAHRGTLYDRRGAALALSLERYRFGVAFDQVRPAARDSVVRLARTDLGIRSRRLQDARASEKYFYAHGPFTAGQVERVRRIRGVELTPVYRREYLAGRLARPLIGALDSEGGRGVSGLERFLDSLLRGVPGEAVLLKDAWGRTYESPGRMVRAPVAGYDVVLTIDRELQEIAEAALERAFDELQPRRGDVVFLDPRTGELLAAASREALASGTETPSASFFVTAFEPGSTAKPFTAGALLELGLVDSTDVVSAENGEWSMPGRSRPIRDDHPQRGPVSLARAVQVSSNIAMAKFSTRLSPEQHFDMLRAFGFGTPTGIEFGAEAGGFVPRPHRWKAGQEGASAAMGYAFEVTPIQLAAAYGAIANDGLLLAPSVIREIRAPDGSIRYRHQPTVVRRAVSAGVASRLRDFLRLAAADSGTGRRAQVRGGVLGKTGTAKLVVNRAYTNRYAASFAGIYPARDPQLVVVVRIEDPKSDEYYGGLIAAPLTAEMLRQALAVRHGPIDRSRLDDGVVVAGPVRPAERASRPGAVAVPWPPSGSKAGGDADPLLVPDVVGKSVREAAYALHRRGFRVRLDGGGTVVSTTPASGATLGAGKVVTVVGRGTVP